MNKRPFSNGIKALALSLVFISLLSLKAGAVSGGGEIFLNDLFGISDASSLRRIRPLWNELVKMVDDYPIDFIVRNPDLSWFEMKSFERERLFHWGFLTEVKRIAPGKMETSLKRIVNRCKDLRLKEMEKQKSTLKDKSKFLNESERLLYGAIAKEQEKRRQIFNSRVRSVTGIKAAESEQIALIMYNCYIINKYGRSEILSDKAVLKQIVTETIDSGFKKLMSRGYSKSDNSILAEREAILTALRSSIIGVGSVETTRDNFLRRVREVWPIVMNKCFPFLCNTIRFGQ